MPTGPMVFCYINPGSQRVVSIVARPLPPESSHVKISDLPRIWYTYTLLLKFSSLCVFNINEANLQTWPIKGNYGKYFYLI